MKISKEKIAIIIVLIIQTIIYVFLGTQKTYIHMDEAYSIGLTNYDRVDITNNDDFYNTWHSKEYYEDYIAVNEKEKFDFTPAYENQKNDVHPPFYYLLLRIASNFSINKFSKWPGLVLNIIILLVTNIIVYKLLIRITKNNILSLIMCLVNGLVIASLESVMYIRMYALNELLLLMIAYLHLINFRKKDLAIKDYIFLGIIALIASLTHYYNILYLFVIAIIYIVNYIRKKQYKNLFKYIITMAIATAISLAIFPYSIQHIFFGYRGQGALGSLLDVRKMLSGFIEYIVIADINIFNGCMWIITIFILGTIAYKLLKNRKITITIKNTDLLLITLPAIVYFIIVALVSPYMEIRYIIPICSFIFIFIICVLNNIINTITTENKAKVTITIVLFGILLMPILTRANINNLYLQHREIVKDVDKKYHNLPTIYVFNTKQNRFLDDIYLFSRIDESYILDINNVDKKEIGEILVDKDLSNGIIVWINEGFEKQEYLDIFVKTNKYTKCEHIKRMNACDIYYIY